MSRSATALVLLALALAGSAAGGNEKFISWADIAQRYGWTDVTGAARDPRCPGTQRGGGSAAFLCATENGGRSWHPIFQAGTGRTSLRGFARMSPSAGVVSISRNGKLPRTLRTGVFWTIDNGKHWYETTAIGPRVENSAGLLLWRDQAGRQFEVTHWPPAGRFKCPGFFAWHALDQHPRRGGNVCVGGRVNAGMRSVPVATPR
jgi:photosystem II stability/assembly factor-like uncharacterized protein